MEDQLHKIRHSLSHIMASVIKEKYPAVKLGIGPVIDNGFYYDLDFDGGTAPTSDDFIDIQKAMRKLVAAKQDFVKEEIMPDAARILFKDEPFKLILIDELAQKGEMITTYKNGNFVDLCAGPHVANTSEIIPDAFKISRLAGAYWKGDEKNKMLTRIYGLAFESKPALEAYEHQQEEAKKRDHRKIGKEMKLFTISDLVGAGLPLLQPNGMIIREAIEDYLWELHKTNGYSRVWTPHITKKNLYETSGHAAKFGEELFRVTGGDEEFYMKPMNCPHHMQIFCDNQFSYRDMPVRYFEPATVYRYEKAGQLSGLARVRAITQDDGHLFCRVSQIGEEVSTIVGIIKKFYTTMKMMDGYWVRLSVRGEDKSKYIGSDEAWAKAEAALEDSAKENNLNYKRGEGEAAFYGPKLDFMFNDAIGREWQLATIQCDFNLPERFDLAFTNEKSERERPVVIHRAIAGSLERFMGMFIEHVSGNFPVWMSPTQIKVIPVRENHNEFAKKIADELKAMDVRVDFDASDEGMGKKIRAGKNNKVPYMLVIGDEEMNSGVLTMEVRDGATREKIGLEELKTKLQKEIKERI
jgi:threonyl-tRNA synthetase